MKIKTFSSINKTSHMINKILLLNNTHNLVCSYGEECEVEIFSLNFDNKINVNEYCSLQKIIDPHYYSIEYLFETKQNSNNENYLLICSDMIHIFYLYDNDTKHNLLQSINEFNYRFIYQVIELHNGNLVSYSNEYKISVFSNLLIENDEYISKDKIINEKKEIYELDLNKINKSNERILYMLELYPDKFAYSYKIDDGEFTRFLNSSNDEKDDGSSEGEKKEDDLNDNSDEFIYIKFMNREYEEISEMKICKVNKDFFNMFQYNENTMVFINSSFLSIINLNYFEIVTTIETNIIDMAYFFPRDFSNNNFINYLILRTNNLKEDESISSNDNENNDNNGNDNDNDNNYNNNIYDDDENNIINDGENGDEKEDEICFYDLNDLFYGIKKYKTYSRNNKEVNLNEYFIPDKILDITVTNDNKEKNTFYFSTFNKDLSIYFSKISFFDEKTAKFFKLNKD
jgi:hypothetical protein